MPVLSALPAHEVMMGAHPVKQPIPTQSVDQIDPFLLLHHHTSTIPSERIVGMRGLVPIRIGVFHLSHLFGKVVFIIEIAEETIV
jgi:hypothetical protein